MKRIIYAVLAGAVFAVLLVAQEKPKPAAPSIPDATKIHYYKALSEFLNAQAQAKQATDAVAQKQQALQAAVGDISKVCGEKYEPFEDKGELICRVKPEVKK